MVDVASLPLLARDAQSHAPGLVWALRLLPGGAAQRLTAAEAAAAIGGAEAGWLWLHVDLLDRRAHDWLHQTCSLPPATRAVLDGHDDALMLGYEDGVVHGVCADFHGELGGVGQTLGRLTFAVGEHMLVTGRRHPLEATEAVRQAVESGSLRPATAFDVLGDIITTFCKATSRHLSAIATTLDQVEDVLVTGRINNERRRLMAARRLTLAVHRPVAALAHLFQDEDCETWDLSEAGRGALRRLGGRLQALDRDVIMVGDRARLLHEEVTTELADESNRSLRALAVMSALLLPGSLIAGIFGMNVKGLPLLDTDGGFWIAMAVTSLATLMFYWALRRAGLTLRF
ncbi:CorA family divalent cation transporter [Labrys wisconsinensis]|uniref:Zinc transporter n=1 Tax=Labrys wisconsinensis TaxID=425677 RepID=A0ABU0J8R2_9HYPH|nr:CorA family divalent cation transporter [Labrys wisconsinensis]MDQ0470666.1 zinc transporter [Labrys wisconsinensis]